MEDDKTSYPPPTLPWRDPATATGSSIAVRKDYEVSGFDFASGTPDGAMKHYLENSLPTSLRSPQMSKRQIKELTLVIFFSMLNYYQHFWDIQNLLLLVAGDIRCDPQVCKAAVDCFDRARKTYLNNPAHRFIPTGASDMEVRVCRLVDNWRLGQAEIRVYPLTNKREKYINNTRRAFQRILQKHPHLISRDALLFPEYQPIECDWKTAPQSSGQTEVGQNRRESSRSPLAKNFSKLIVDPRVRSPLKGISFIAEDDVSEYINTDDDETDNEQKTVKATAHQNYGRAPVASQTGYESVTGVIAHTIQKVQSMRLPGDSDRVIDHFNFVLQALQVAQSNAGSIDVHRGARAARGNQTGGK